MMIYYEYGTTTNKLSFPRGWLNLRVSSHNNEYWSIITYNRELTKEECDSVGLKLYRISSENKEFDKLVKKEPKTRGKAKRIKI